MLDRGGDTGRADLEISVPGYAALCVWSTFQWLCPPVLAFDLLDLWFLPAGSSPPPPLPSAEPTATPLFTPTRTPTPTLTATPKATPVGQPTKVVGQVCVYADRFQEQGGVTTATGNLCLGPKETDGKCSRRFYFVDNVTLLDKTVVAAQVVWRSTGDIEVAGAVQMQPHRIPILAGDKLLVNRTSGDLTLGGKVEKYVGDLFPKNFEFPDDIGLTLSAIHDYVELSAEIHVKDIPENPDFKFDVRGRVTATGDLVLVTDASTLKFTIAGGELIAEKLSLSSKGVLQIGKATLTFKGIPPIVVEGLTLGGQGLLSIAGFKVWGFVGFSPLQFGGGGASPYKVVCPAGHSCGFGSAAALQALALAGGRTDTVVDILPSRQIALIESVNALNWDQPENLIVVQPDGQSRELTPVISHQEGGEFKRLYVIDRPPVGQWTLQAQAGNMVVVLGTDPEPALTIQVEQLPAGAAGLAAGQAVRVVQGSPAHMIGNDGPQAAAALHALADQEPLRLTQQGRLRITWQSNAADAQPVRVELYAEDAAGKRWPVTTSDALNGVYDWQPAIPGGVYTFTVAADDGRNMPVISQVLFDYHDTTPPAAVQGVTAHVAADGVATVAWDDAAADPDVVGYRIALDGGDVITVTRPIGQAIVGTLDPGEMVAAEVAAYDMSGNVGAGTRVAARAAALQVVAQRPADGDVARWSRQVLVAFNQPIVVQSFTLWDAKGAELPGQIEGLTYDLGAIIPIAEPVWGVRFTPQVGWLPQGDYTAGVTVAGDDVAARQVQLAGLSSVVAPAGTTATYRWSFTVGSVPKQVWLPLVAR